MRRTLLYASVAVVVLTTSAVWYGTGLSQEAKGGPMLSHDVYFSLKDNSPDAKKKLVAACKKYLKGHEGEVFSHPLLRQCTVGSDAAKNPAMSLLELS